MRKSKFVIGVLAAMSCLAVTTNAVEVQVSGNGDADVWYDAQAGQTFNSHDVNVSVTGKFSETISATVGVTSVASAPPAGAETSDNRWGTIDFDGVWIDWQATEKLAFSVGDLVYNFGKFNYYFNKNYGMITPEIFPRGLQASYNFGVASLTVMGGALDDFWGTRMMGGVVNIAPSEAFSVNLINVTSLYYDATQITAGAEITAVAGPFTTNANFGFTTQSDSVGMNLLLETAGSFGDFSVAASFYKQLKNEGGITDFATANGDNMFVYVEPGYTFTPTLAFGLPLEYHIPSVDADGDIWVVPTLYVYPTEGVQWWLWGQAVIPGAEGAETGYYAGSEVIFEF